MGAIRTGSPSYDMIMRISVEHPLLTVEQIAALLQRPLPQVSAIMRNDAFLERRARLIMERYGHKITGIRGQLLDTASDALTAIRQRIADPNSDVAPETLLKAADWLMKFVAAPIDQTPTAAAAAQGVAQGASANVTINLTPSDLNRAIEARNHAIRTIDLTPTETTHEPRPRISSKERT